MYSGINRYSVLGIWKEVNLAAVLDVGHYFTDVPYCNLAGNPVRIAAVLVYLIEMIFAIRGWGLDGWNRAAVSVQSITVLGAAAGCSIRQWMLLHGIGWMICGVFAAEIITFLSRLLRRQVVAMLAGFLVLGLPVLVMLLVIM